MINTVNDADTSGGVGGGQLGDFRGADTPKRDTFNFYLDQVELDLNKTFGENIRARADLDFGRAASGSYHSVIEQAYVTANIPLGNGVEFLVGRFNTPIGTESVDRNDNTALSYSNIFNFIRPHNTTGAKIYYAFNDNIDWHLYVVNNLFDTIAMDTTIPSFGTRIGFTWGEKGKESTFGLSYAAGPEGAAAHLVTGAAVPVSLKKHFTHIADLDFSVHVTDAFLIAGEAIYRQDNLGGAYLGAAGLPLIGVPGNPNAKAFGGNLLLGYSFNETWNAYLRYDFLNDRQGLYTTNVHSTYHDFALGAGYQITDGAKMKLEYRLDLQRYTGGAPKGYNNGFAAEFAYNF
ncbi:MAG: outer membrane beta-barrel protein [Deltaproteobacteria bacterium]|nr:outer membrane beta-barrel protein [Deltaproteobacteria bacterium]